MGIDYFYDADHDAQEDSSETHGEEIDGLGTTNFIIILYILFLSVFRKKYFEVFF